MMWYWFLMAPMASNGCLIIHSNVQCYTLFVINIEEMINNQNNFIESEHLNSQCRQTITNFPFEILWFEIWELLWGWHLSFSLGPLWIGNVLALHIPISHTYTHAHIHSHAHTLLLPLGCPPVLIHKADDAVDCMHVTLSQQSRGEQSKRDRKRVGGG